MFCYWNGHQYTKNMGRGALEPTELISEVSVIERKDGTNVTDLNQQFLNNYIKGFGLIK